MSASTQRETIQLTFDVDAALLVEIGERSVARRSVALAELIKNAYDADATNVIISLIGVTTSQGEIIISDNGSGMTMEAMKRDWMRIATTDAAVHAFSKRFGRHRTGAKGVGRFACKRLGSRLKLTSTSNSLHGFERIEASFDWDDFEPGLGLSQIATDVTREIIDGALPTGTTLRISGLTEDWGESDLADLADELVTLTDPERSLGSVHRGPQFEVDPGFEQIIEAPEFPSYQGPIEQNFLNASWGILTAKVNEAGQPDYELRIRTTEVVTRFRPSNISFDLLAGTTLIVHMMVYRGNAFKDTGFSLQQARDFGRERGGVKIYLDGFRVFSYGSSGDDWLELDQDRARRLVSTPEFLSGHAEDLERPMLLLPGNMQLFGSVAISRERETGLIVNIGRERMVENDSFVQLKRFVRAGIDWMTVRYARESAATRRSTRPQIHSADTSNHALSIIRDLVDREATISAQTKRTIEQSIQQVETLVTRERDIHITELSMLRVLASAGTTVLLFDHTLRAMSGQLLDVVDRLNAIGIHLPSDHRTGYGEILKDLEAWSQMTKGQASLVGLLVGPEARTRKKRLAVRPVVATLQQRFFGYSSRFGINFANDVPATARTPPVHEAEVYAVLLNLLTNSFKAVRERSIRRVKVEASVNAREFKLRVLDTGTGVPADQREEVFEPFVTTSQPDPVLGVGTGLGLKIVRDLARAWGGNAYFVEASSPWQTAIELAVPIENRQ